MENQHCSSCEVLVINGILCPEGGCPDAWKDYNIECAWCGQYFRPEMFDQRCCDQSCTAGYNGEPFDCETPLPANGY